MDEYLVPGSSLIRLYEEYQKYKSLVIAYDFDNTIYDFHGKGNTYEDVISLLRELKAIGCFMICFTANANTEMIRCYLKAKDIPADAINENPPFFKCEERKIYFNALLDDRAGLSQVYTELKLLIHFIK